MKTLKLGSIIKDTATGLKGMLTTLQVEMNGLHFYGFQPSGLNPETGQPVDRIWLTPERITGAETVIVPGFPLEILGSKAEDKATGFNGTCINLVLHISGCIHVIVQPSGQLKTGAAITSCEFDIRRLKGKMIPELTEVELEKDRVKKPSPSPITPYRPKTTRDEFRPANPI